MRHDGKKAVAPLNQAPRWPEGYVQVLREMGAVERTIPYCIAWVRGFFARFPGRRRRDLGRPEIELFLEETGRRGHVTNRQLAQAKTALEVYYEQFRGIGLAPRPETGVSGESSGRSAAPPPQSRDAQRPAVKVIPSSSVTMPPAKPPAFTATYSPISSLVKPKSSRKPPQGASALH